MGIVAITGMVLEGGWKWEYGYWSCKGKKMGVEIVGERCWRMLEKLGISKSLRKWKACSMKVNRREKVGEV